MKKKNYTIKKLSFKYFEISTTFKNHLISRQFEGYTKKEAVTKFQEYLLSIL